MHAFIIYKIYIHTYITYIIQHTYTHTYLHTYIHTYVRTYMYIPWSHKIDTKTAGCGASHKNTTCMPNIVSNIICRRQINSTCSACGNT